MRSTRFLTIMLAFASLSALGCGSSSTAPNVPPADVHIVLNASTMGTAGFSPDPFTGSFATRAQVTWVNADAQGGGYGGGGVTHHLVSDAGLFDSGNLPAGATFAFTFAASGTYMYHCTIHPTMVGTITLTP